MIEENKAIKMYFIGNMEGCVISAFDCLKRIKDVSERNNIPLSPKAQTLYTRLLKMDGDLSDLAIELSKMAESLIE